MGSNNHSIDMCVSNPKMKNRSCRDVFPRVIVTLSVSLVSMMMGYTSAYTSPPIDSMTSTGSPLIVTKDEAFWICSIMSLFALLGGMLGAPLMEYIGRKMTIIATVILFNISWILIAVASNVWFLYFGHSFAGISVAVASLAVPVYFRETINSEDRGTLGKLPTALQNIGILACYIFGNYLSRNKLALVGMILALPFFALVFLIPETPRWYVSKGFDEKARNSLQWLRGADTNITDEFIELKNIQIE